ncbi:ABC transporter permease [Microbacterium esteraromaticum]|uniref:Spermidine/putrescine transport system permease protein PotC n=1 Tax=Microbacterium esteraromaticum TaxID=57043 RepID=A0A939IWL9_9MICO|nr:ABC transporter permease [Microbacterium esteraromaticum]MBN7794761.1 ABC transporter permease [Microbacterium esteraromaticum]MBN8206843.1 ABC transporter permease [Microbacterium esteraromaticum]MBN8416998.1 ABC transporter permease [Microbacterium esteraromaticum]MBN8425625.1 ABC transporter permease [Microbacterium esteraromaticum]MCA1307380.1 ABC transporter permease [Microbacterium esteraromaticum]
MTDVRIRRRGTGDRILGIWSVLVYAFLFLPIIVIVLSSFNSGRLLVAWDGFSLEPFAALFEKPVIRDAVMVSLRTGLIAALLASVLGTLAGVAMARRPGRWVWWFLMLLLLVAVTPEIVDAIALLPWMVFLGQDLGIGIFNDGTMRLVVGHSLFSVAIVSYIVRSRLVGLDEKLEEASADLYAPPLRTFLRVTLPLAMPAVLAGFLLSFTLSLDNTVVSAFVQVSGTTPWPVYVLSSLRSGLRPEIAAVSTVMLLLTLVSLALVALVLKRAGDSATDIARTMGGG